MVEWKNGSDLQRRIIDYWDQRSLGYSLATLISYKKDRHVLEVLRHIVNIDRKMRIADMGTSAGLMAMWLREMGHDVTALDLSEQMISKAERNAINAGLDIDFRVMDVQSPNLPKSSFDMIVSKSVLWCLEDPVGAYESWIRLLKPGGYLVILDGNYYLDLYDDDYRKKKEYYDLKNGVDNNLHAKTNMGGVDMNIIRDLAKELPLTRQRRPGWDVATLLGLGMTDIRVVSLDSYSFSVLTENGLMKLPNNFIVCAQKPFDDISPYERSEMTARVEDSMLDSISDRIRTSDDTVAPVMKALSDQCRIRIAKSLMSGSLSVRQIASVVEASQSLVSHNLKVLRDAGIVERSREGKEVCYRLGNVYALNTIREMCDLLANGTDGN